MTPEFSRPVRLDAIGAQPHAIEIEAIAAERAALAARFGIEAIEALRAAATVRRETAGILIEGRVSAQVVQRCVATDAPLTAAIDEPFRLLFSAEAAQGGDVDLDADALDTLPIEGGAIDLGEAAAETLSLALDPYRRAPDADAALRAAGVLREGETRADGPFAGLAAKLSGGGAP